MEQLDDLTSIFDDVESFVTEAKEQLKTKESSSVKQIDFSKIFPDIPGFSIVKSDLLEAVRLFAKLLENSDANTKLVFLEIFSDKLSLTVSVLDSLLKIWIPVNYNYQINSSFYIDFNFLKSLIYGSKEELLFFANNPSGWEVKFPDGFVKVETFTSDSKPSLKVFDVFQNITSTSIKINQDLILDLLTISQLGQRPEEKIFICKNSKTYLNAGSVLIEHKDSVVDSLVFTFNDLKILRYIGNSVLDFYRSDTHCRFYLKDKLDYIFPLYKKDFPEISFDLEGDSFDLNVRSFYSKMNLIYNLSDLGATTLNLTDSGVLKLKSFTSNGSPVEFDLLKDIEITSPYSVRVPTKILTKVLSFLLNDINIKLSLSRDGKASIVSSSMKFLMGMV